MKAIPVLLTILNFIILSCSDEKLGNNRASSDKEAAINVSLNGQQQLSLTTSATQVKYHILCDNYQAQNLETASANIPIQSQNCYVALSEFSYDGRNYTTSVSSRENFKEGAIISFNAGNEFLFVRVQNQLKKDLNDNNTVSFLAAGIMQGDDLDVSAPSMTSASVNIQVGVDPLPKIEVLKAETSGEANLKIDLQCNDTLTGQDVSDLACGQQDLGMLQFIFEDFPAQVNAQALEDLFAAKAKNLASVFNKADLQSNQLSILLAANFKENVPKILALKLKDSHSISFVKIIDSKSQTPTPPPSDQPSPPGNDENYGVGGLWLSQNELDKLPSSGKAFEALKSAAMSSWGTARLDDNNAAHDVKTLAGAIYAAKTKDESMRQKVITGLKSAMQSPLSRALELSRGLQSYIIAADLIGYQDPGFKAFVKEVVYKNIQGHSGSGLFGTAVKSPNNWGGHARSSLAAAALYLNDQAMKDAVIKAHKEFIGEVVTSPQMVYTSTAWHFDTSKKAGINRANAGLFSGVLPEDWRRDEAFDPKTVTSLEDMKALSTGYAWEGMQGALVTAVILHRAGLVPMSAGDHAIVRALDRLYSIEQYPESDDTWIPYLANYYTGKTYSHGGSGVGKGIGYTDYTHSK